MKRTLLGLLAAILLAAAVASGANDAERVLILVNDAVPPESGTGRKGASVYVGEHYADRRGIPRSNIVHLTIPLACCENDPRAWDSWNVTWESFKQHVRTPLRRFLETRNLTDRILYLVSTYGVPLRVGGGPFGKIDGVSVDTVLAAMHARRDVLGLRNPYQAAVEEWKAHFRDWTNPLGWKMYLVTRLDGPSALIATGLVDKAIKAEASLQKTDGTGYFDYRHLEGSDGYARGDRTVLNAYQLSTARGFASVLNDRTRTGAMIRKAPRTLWAWGWYSGPNTWDGYEFVDGVSADGKSPVSTEIGSPPTTSENVPPPMGPSGRRDACWDRRTSS